MKVLVVGGGGREHAIGWALHHDSRVTRLCFAPGNPGTATLGTNLPCTATDLDGIQNWCASERPDLVVVGPEAPLCLGLADRLRALDIPVFGPNRDGARLEGSKAFTKEIMEAAGIPTGKAVRFTDYHQALAYSRTQPYPQVIKADGLAAGKGVIIAQNPWSAAAALYDLMARKIFGNAGAEVLLEEFLEGEEVSIHALTDGKRCVLLPASQDHKRIFDHDQGPNTGGMGAYAPAPVLTDALRQAVITQILEPLLQALNERGIDYRGVLYGGVMVTRHGPKVFEFNCRFGDPETQVLFPLLDRCALDLLLAAAQGDLTQVTPRFLPGAALTVVLAAPGYPEQPHTGDPITGLDTLTPSPTQILFHAGTRTDSQQTVTAGGRVLAATGLGPDLGTAQKQAYLLANQIHFPGQQFRTDIGARALRPQP
jgi:phosphoribosylamine--glycine ligase